MRRRRNRSGAAGAGATCPMCGRVVVVGRDGRCPLGHVVGVPEPVAASPVTPPEPAAPGPAALPEPAVGDHAGPTPAPGDTDLGDPFAEPDDRQVVGSPPGGESEPADARAAIDELLGWDEPAASSLEVELPSRGPRPGTGPLPAPPAAHAAEADTDGEPVDDADDEAEDRRAARRRAAGIVSGTVAATAAIVGSLLALPL